MSGSHINGKEVVEDTDNDQYTFEDEEVEVTDNEASEVEGEEAVGIDEDEEENVAQQFTPVPKQRVVSTPVSTKSAPRKVIPSQSVKSMKMSSPELTKSVKANTLPTDKNPFTTVGNWTPETLASITIVVPTLISANETTNELTRTTKPEARYWKAPMSFRYGNFTSSTIRFDNVQIPHHTGKGYGSNFVYLCLPGFAAEIFATAAKERRPTVVTEKGLVPDSNRWWKVANNVDDCFGVINAQTKKFQRKNLQVILEATSAGITASVILTFLFKASTDSLSPLKANTGGTIAVVLERGYITSTDVNVEMPVKNKGTKVKVEPTAVSRDIADDALMKRLAELGL